MENNVKQKGTKEYKPKEYSFKVPLTNLRSSIYNYISQYLFIILGFGVIGAATVFIGIKIDSVLVGIIFGIPFAVIMGAIVFAASALVDVSLVLLAFISIILTAGTGFVPLLILAILAKCTKENHRHLPVNLDTIDKKIKVGDIVPFAGLDWIVVSKNHSSCRLFSLRSLYNECYDQAYKEIKYNEVRGRKTELVGHWMDHPIFNEYVDVSYQTDVKIYGKTTWDRSILRYKINETVASFDEESKKKLMIVDTDLKDYATILSSNEIHRLKYRGYLDSYMLDNYYNEDNEYRFWTRDREECSNKTLDIYGSTIKEHLPYDMYYSDRASYLEGHIVKNAVRILIKVKID